MNIDENVNLMIESLVDEIDRLIANIERANREALIIRTDINRILETVKSVSDTETLPSVIQNTGPG